MNIRRTPLYAESWNVAFRNTASGDILTNKDELFHIIPNSRRYWAADPMVFEYDNSIYIFAELYDYTKRRGIIGVTEFDGKKFGKWKPVITEKFHMSYPYIFKHNEKIYMIPETSEANKLFLYVCVDFPYNWKLEKVICSDVKLVDTSIIKSDDSFIGFTESINDEIHDYKIILSDNFEMIKKEEISDSGNGEMRCGGKVFKHNHSVVRVCQDCKNDYGEALIFRICDNDFNQLTSKRIIPTDFSYDKTILLDGMHTYSSIENMEVIDIKTRRFSVLNLIFRILNKITP